MEKELINISLPYGTTTLTFSDSRYPFSVIEPRFVAAAINPIEKVTTAIDAPIGGFDWGKFTGAKNVAIAINDKTRPVPFRHLLPPLLNKLHSLGITKEAIRLFVATGTHTPATQEEINKTLPVDIVDNYCILTHNCDDNDNLQFLGNTTHGTPIHVNKGFYSADLKIVTGNIEPHHFMGFSGGNKSASIGLTGRETINRNHALLLNGNTNMGEYESNPMRMDVEEIGQTIGVHYSLNSIFNSEKEIVDVYSGDPLAVMQAGIPLSRSVCSVEVSKRFDIVIASVGGYPKDINLYQSQKALSNACMITKTGGTVILLAECIDGTGSDSFSSFIKGKNDPETIISYFTKDNFRVGPHKAYQFARQLQQVRVIIVSSLSNVLAEQCLLTPSKDLDSAFALAIKDKPSDTTIAIMPHATNTIPYIVSR